MLRLKNQLKQTKKSLKRMIMKWEDFGLSTPNKENFTLGRSNTYTETFLPTIITSKNRKK